MEDIIGKTTSYILLIFGFFFLVPLFLAVNLEYTTRNYISSTVNTFTETARTSGMLRKEDYSNMVDRLNSTGNSFSIRLEHKAKVAVPNEADEGYQISYLPYSLQDVYAEWEGVGKDMIPNTEDDTEGKGYQMKDGDYLTISVVSNESTLAGRFLGILSGHPEGMKVSASAGGIVGKTAR